MRKSILSALGIVFLTAACQKPPALNPDQFAELYFTALLLQAANPVDSLAGEAEILRFLADQKVAPADYNASLAYYRANGTRWLTIQEKVVTRLQGIRSTGYRPRADSAAPGKNTVPNNETAPDEEQ
jgi:hypothetical protein